MDSVESLISAFAVLDASKTGHISLAQLQRVWTLLNMPPVDLSSFLRCSGFTLEDGRVEYPKFLKWLCGAEGGADEAEVIPYPPLRPEEEYTEDVLDGFRQKYLRKESLLEALESGDTVLIRGTWLLDQAYDEKVLPRRQELPPEAIWDVKEEWHLVSEARHKAAWVQDKVALAALSYCWATPEHPDPKGEQLQRLVPVLETLLNYVDEVPIFIDWCSIYQAPRTDEQQAAFKRALRNVNLWYAHELVFSLLLTVVPEGVVPYKERGWPSFEFAISGLIKNDNMFLDLAGIPDEIGDCRTLGDIRDKFFALAKVNRPPPCTPATFRAKLEDLRFTNGADRAFVMQKYVSTFKEVMASAEYIELAGLNWSAEDGKELACALPWCKSLRQMDVTQSRFGTEGIQHIAAALPDCPQLETLDVESCDIGDMGVRHLVETLDKSRVANLWIARNGISDIGVELLAEYVEREGCQLREISLKGNEVTDAGAARLAAVLSREGCPLTMIRLNEMATISAASAEVLAVALKENSCLKKLDLRNTSIGDAGKQCMQALMEECPHLEVLL